MVLSTSLQKPMFELWASIKQKNFLFIPAHKQQIFQTATKEIKLMHWDTSDAVNGKKNGQKSGDGVQTKNQTK